MGMFSTADTTGNRSLDSRRKIFYQYPTGSAPLMGLLSMLPSEDTDKTEFGWWERRFPVLRTATVASGTAPFANGDGSAFTDGANFVADTEYRVNVLDTTNFKATHVIELRDIAITGTSVTIKGLVTDVISATVLKFRPFQAYTAVQNATNENNDKIVAIIGNANAEGARSGTGISVFPTNIKNYTQIFRTAFAISRSALKGGLAFDKSGPYKLLAKENGLRHMVELEKAFLFGEKHTITVPDPETGDLMPENKTGGIVWFLEQWEKAASPYRGASSAAITSNSDPDKRIIDVGGAITKANYNMWISNLFRKTNDKAYEKLCFCGGKFLEVLNTMFETQITRNAMIKNKEKDWEFIVHSHTTLRGTVHYKVHPLFDEDPDLTASGLFLDMGNLHYRPLSDSDTTMLKGRQENDRDGRKDEWITEAGLELQFPESCMFMKDVTSYGGAS